MENHGVTPDIEVQNLPEEEIQRIDTQLNQAIEYLMKEIKEHPRTLPKRPSYDQAYLPTNPGTHTVIGAQMRRTKTLFPLPELRSEVSFFINVVFKQNSD